MGAFVYSLCALAALACAALLFRAYGHTRSRLLLWSGLCFAFLTISNALIVVDLVVFPDIDVFVIRNLITLLALSCLLHGLIWESR